jgi:hypothetical protein
VNERFPFIDSSRAKLETKYASQHKVIYIAAPEEDSEVSEQEVG